MINTRRIGQFIAAAMGQLLSAIFLLCLAACLLLLMPGMAALSLFIELSGFSISTPSLWVLSLLVSLGIFFLILTLVRDPEKSGKVYGGICIGVLILSITLSLGFQLHFGQRCSRRFLGITEVSITSFSENR